MTDSEFPQSTTRPWATALLVIGVIVVAIGAMAAFLYINLFAPPRTVDELAVGDDDPTCRAVSATEYVIEVPLQSIGESSYIDLVDLTDAKGMTLTSAMLLDLQPGVSEFEFTEAEPGYPGVSLNETIAGAQTLVLVVENSEDRASASGVVTRNRSEVSSEELTAMQTSISGTACDVAFAR